MASERIFAHRVAVYGDVHPQARRPVRGWTGNWCATFLPVTVNVYRPCVSGQSHEPVGARSVNCVNARLRNQAGVSWLVIHPRCKQLDQDLERVQWNTYLNGNAWNGILDKSYLDRTYPSDALGSSIAHQFPLRSKKYFFKEWPF